MSWVFLEYVNQRGKGAVAEWLDHLDPGIREDVKAALDAHLQIIRPMEQLKRPWVGKLKNKHGARCAGLYELRFRARKIQWRPLFCYLPGERVVILAGATERGLKIVPKGICVTAHGRAAELAQSGRLRPYGYK